MINRKIHPLFFIKVWTFPNKYWQYSIIKPCIKELKSKEMSDMLNEAKTLVGANEKLHRTLQLETDRRKVLHNKFEDLKYRIYVYVRIRCLDDSEKSRNCKIVLEREDKTTRVLSSRNKRGSIVKS